jgi:hypothetical protein
MVGVVMTRIKQYLALITLFSYVNLAVALPILALFGLGAGASAGSGATAAATLAATGGSSITLGQALTASAVLHAGIIAIKLSEPNTNPTEPPITIHLKPNTPLSVPAGWSAAQSGQIQPTPPLTQPLSFKYQPSIASFTSDPYYDTPQLACVAGENIYNTNSNQFDNIEPGSTNYISGNCHFTYAGSTVTTYFPIQSTPSCPLGYSVGVECSLLNATQVEKPADNKCEILSSGNGTFTPDPRDPDCSNADLLAAGIDLTVPNKVIVTNPDATDRHIITQHPDGSVDIDHKYKSVDTLGGPQTVVEKVHIDSDGMVSTTSTNRTNGHDDLDVPQSTGSGSITVDFDKTGLATTSGQASQLGATQQTNTKLDAIKTDTFKVEENTKKIADNFDLAPDPDLTGTEAQFNPSSQDVLFVPPSQYRGLFDNITERMGIPAGGACSNAVINTTMFGQATTWDFQNICGSISPMINYMFWVLTTIFVWREAGSLRVK